MPMVPFYTKFPDLAFKETRSATVRGFKGLPDGEYAFLESYCDELGCDCRRVFILVVSRDTENKTLATINYGWESIEFYREWAHGETDLEDLKGPSLALFGQQTKLAPYLLRLFKEVVLEDESYVNRLRRHYKMFKRAIEGKHGVTKGKRRSQSKSKKRAGKK